MPTDEIAVVGRIGAPYGVKGWVTVQSFTVPAENLLDYMPWYEASGKRGPWHPVQVLNCRAHKKAFVAQFQDVQDRDAAAALTGRLIGVAAASLPALDDEFYWRDLVGCQVSTTAGVALGSVVELLETGAHDVLVIRPPEDDAEQKSEDVLIPFVADYVDEVDINSRHITVDWDTRW